MIYFLFNNNQYFQKKISDVVEKQNFPDHYFSRFSLTFESSGNPDRNFGYPLLLFSNYLRQF